MVDKELQRLAVALGIRNAQNLNTVELIECIRHQEGDMPCFSQLWSAPCRIKGCTVRKACTSHPPGGQTRNR
jgi:hypothetical protein